MNVLEPTLAMVEPYTNYVEECLTSGVSHYQEAVKDPAAELERIIDAANGRNLPEGHLPCKTYFAMQDEKILGAIRYRIGDSDFCEKYIGHIGYETRPSSRKLGVAKYLYAHVVNERLVGPALVICKVTNIASQKVIESMPHEFLGEHYNDFEKMNVRKYRVTP